jgi:hypothetical protein
LPHPALSKGEGSKKSEVKVLSLYVCSLKFCSVKDVKIVNFDDKEGFSMVQ